jgi:hypothetical protein
MILFDDDWIILTIYRTNLKYRLMKDLHGAKMKVKYTK